MRLWSLHPKYLDPCGLLALWREGLLARAVLRGETRGYQHHPQLARFRAQAAPRRTIDAYLHTICDEADLRGYHFDRRKLGPRCRIPAIRVTRGQLAYEWRHLQRKLARRSPATQRQWAKIVCPHCHPLLRRRAGGIEPWERT
jgi:hypothetical protein